MLMMIMVCFVGFMTSGCGFKRVDAGYEGVKFNRFGSAKGLTEVPLPPGTYYLSMNEEIYEYPVHMEQYPFTASITEGSPKNEEISFQTKEGLAVSCDISVMAQTIAGQSPKVFAKFRKPFPDILKTFFYQEIRDSFNRYASAMAVEAVYGEGKIELLKKVNEDITKKSLDWGIQIDQLSYLSQIRVPKSVEDSINQKVVATQLAQQRDNEIQTAVAEAKKKVEAAKGEANKRIEEAKGEAEALNIQSEALRKNPEVLKLRQLQMYQEAILRWNGVPPATLFLSGLGSNTMSTPSLMMNIPETKMDSKPHPVEAERK